MGARLAQRTMSVLFLYVPPLFPRIIWPRNPLWLERFDVIHLTDCQRSEDFSERPCVPTEEALGHSADAYSWVALRPSFGILASSVPRISPNSFPRVFVRVFARYKLARPQFARLFRRVIACSEWVGSRSRGHPPLKRRRPAVAAFSYLVLQCEEFGIRCRSAVWPFARWHLEEQELAGLLTRLVLGEIRRISS